jgi:PE-PPE domain
VVDYRMNALPREVLMVSRECRVLGLGISAVAGASVLGLTSMTGPAVAFGADTALIMGPSGVPTPPQSYVDAAENLYLVPKGYGAYTPQALDTPEQWYPITGVNSLPIDTSIAQGVTILNGAINQQIAAGNHVVVFGYSQSSVVASQEMAQLASSSNPPSPGQLSFVLAADPDNPNGGVDQRFAGLSLPSLGETYNEAPTAGSPYPTAVYTQEYDGLADFPQYPIDLLSDLNADVGVFTQHFGYADLTPQQIGSAKPLPTTGNTTTQYYMIPTTNLPLLAPVRLIPLIGDPLADLLQPDLTVLVNLGYGSITNGWSPGPANVPTPFGLFPTNINPADVLTALANGAVQGVTNALNDLQSPQLFDLSPLSGFLAGLNTFGLTPSNTPSLLQLVAAFSTNANGDVPVTSSGGIVNTLTSVVSDDLAVALPLADTALAIGASLPEYDAQLFTSQLAAGNLLNAVGMPIAADLAVAPVALIFGAVFPIVNAVAETVTPLAELTGLEPNPTGTPAAAPASTAGTDPAPSAATTASAANTNAQPAVSTNASATHTPSAPAAAPASATPKPGQGGVGGSGNGASSNRAPSTPGPTGLGTAVTGSGAHAPAISAVAGAGVGGGTGVTGTSGSSGSTDSTARTGLHRTHG